MSPIFRPTAEVSTGTTELSHAGLSAGAESQLTGSNADISKAHQFFSTGAESHAMAAATPIVPGAESAAMAMPMVPGASEPISPLIQLIMRMPGQIGLLSSFFEALGNFFMPDLSALGFDPSLMGDPNLLAHLPSAEHFAIDPSLLPDGAPILEDGGIEKLTTAFDAPARGQLLQHSEMSRFGEQLKVSSGVDAIELRFEGAQLDLDKPGHLLSGPAMSDTAVGNHLAGTQRLFSDRFQGSLFTKPGMNSSMIANSAGSTGTATSSAMNVSGSAFGAQPDSLSAVGNVGDSMGGIAPAGGGFGNSAFAGGGDGGNLIATNSADTFRPTLGAPSGDHASSYLQQSTPSDAASSHSSNASHGIGLKGLKAKELSLDSFKPGANAAKLDHSTTGDTATKVDSSAANKLNTAKTTASSAKATAASAKASTASAKSAAASGAKPSHIGNHKIADASSAKAGSRSLLDKTPGKDAARLDTSKETSQVADNTAIASDLKPTNYTIRAGDCLWNIAKDQLGSAMKWQDIYNMNQDLLGTNPDLIHTGVTIKLPGVNGEIANAGAEASKYVVKPGDCLWDIAKDQMHDATKWGDLYKANSDVIGSNARLIHPGQELTIPGAENNALVADAGPAAGADQLAQAAPTAEAPMLSAQAPQTNFGTTGTMDGATATQPMEMQAPAAMQQQAPMVMQQAPGTVMQSPATLEAVPQVQQVAPVVQQAPIQPGTMQQLIPTLQTGPGAAIPAPSVHMVGPGAASAATLNTTPLNPALSITAGPRGVVNSSLGADIASFLSQRR